MAVETDTFIDGNVDPVIAPMTSERVRARFRAVYYLEQYSGRRQVRPDGSIRRLSDRAMARILTRHRGDDLGVVSATAVGKYRARIAAGERPRSVPGR